MCNITIEKILDLERFSYIRRFNRISSIFFRKEKNNKESFSFLVLLKKVGYL